MSADFKKLVPKLRFPEFKDEWQVKKLGNVSVFYDQKRIPVESADRQKMQGAYPYYGASGIIDYIDEYIFDGEYILLAEDGANILMRSSPVAFLANGKFWVNNHAHVLRAKGSNGFLVAYLENLRYEKYNTGTAQPKLNAEICKNIEIVLPGEKEQQKIADFLTVVDKKIESIDKKIELLKQYKKAVMQKIFTLQIRFRSETADVFPDWKTKTIDEIFTGHKGSGLSWDDVTSSGIRKCILYGELYTKYSERIENVISRTNSKAGTPSKKNDLLLPCSTTTSGIDLANATALDEEGVLLGGDISILRFRNEGSNLFYAYYLSHFLKDKLAAYGQGSTIVHAYYSHYKNMKVFEPCVEEQEKIAEFLGGIDSRIDSEKKRLNTAGEFKKALLSGMMI